MRRRVRKRKPPSNSCCEIPFAVASRPGCSSGARGRKGEPNVHRSRQILLAANVSFGGLHGGMSQQALDLLQFAARSVAQSRAGPPQGVGCQRLNANLRRAPLDYVPDDILGDSVAPNGSVFSN